jgi:soluble lytic murein transglycosylase-like protein
MQLMPETAKDLGVTNAFDPAQNVDGGTKHLKYLIEKYDGKLALALAAYNAGEGTVEKYGGIPPYSETIQYIKKIERLIEHGNTR